MTMTNLPTIEGSDPALQDEASVDVCQAAAVFDGPRSRKQYSLRNVVQCTARSPVFLVLMVGAVLHVLWLALLANSGGDIAAQDAWAGFASEYPGSAYHLGWYGGIHPVSCSVISPYIMALFGVRTTMLVAGTVACSLLALILVRSPDVRQPLPPALAGTFALTCNAVSGRVTFGLGLCFALGAVASVYSWPSGARWRSRAGRASQGAAAVVLSGLATASSPVAGLFLGVVAAALFLCKRRAAACALSIAPCVVIGLSACLFPFSGTQPMSLGTAMTPLLCAVGVVFLVPKRWRTLRLASAI